MQSDVRKPGIPVLVPCATAFWICTAISYTMLAGKDETLTFTVALSSLCASFVALIATVFTTRKKPSSILMFAAMGLLLGASSMNAYNEAIEDIPTEQDWVFALTSDPKKSEFGYTANADGLSGNGAKAKVKLYLDDGAGLFDQAKITAKTSLHRIEKDRIELYCKKGIVATARVNGFEQLSLDPFRQAVYEMRGRAIDAFSRYGDEQAGILQALVCGYRSTIEEGGMYEKFKLCGLAHIVAVSGAHLAIITALFGLLLRTLRLGRRASFIGSASFVVVYLLFAGIPISAVRAAIMVILSMMSGLFGRRNASLSSLSICVIAFIAIDASCSVSVSLLLSTGSTFGIIIFSRLIASWFSNYPNRFQKCIGDPLALTLTSNLVTMPYSVATFGQLPLISPLANVIATPLFSLACVVGLVSAIAACINDQMGMVLITLASICAMPLNFTVNLLSSLPFACVKMEVPLIPMLLLTLALFVITWKMWPSLTFKSAIAVLSTASIAGASVLLMNAIRTPVLEDEVIMLDVGQGDAFLIASKGSSVLVDTGNQDAKLLDSLGKLGVKNIDAVLLTHADDDHCGSIDALLGSYAVGVVCVASDMLGCECDKCTRLVSLCRRSIGSDRVIGVSFDQNIKVGAFDLEIVWPRSYEDQGGNSDSLCFTARLDSDGDGDADWTTLFTGDAETEQLERMLENGSFSDIDVLKVGHHGSRASVSAPVLEILDPEVALISVGKSNRYGHPTSTALELLAQTGTQILRTDEMGSVRLVFSEDSITVK